MTILSKIKAAFLYFKARRLRQERADLRRRIAAAKASHAEWKHMQARLRAVTTELLRVGG